MWMKLYEFYICLRNLLVDTVCLLILHSDCLPNERELVLVVRLDAIGDFVLWLDSVAALRELFPSKQYKLVLLGNILWRELAESCQLFDESIFVDNCELCYKLHYRLKVWKKLRSRKWAYTIHPTFSHDFNCGDSAVRVSGAVERIGSAGDLSNQLALQKWISNSWYTKLLPTSDNHLMELERNAEFIRNLGGTNFKAGLPVLEIQEKIPSEFNTSNYIVVVPGASLPIKQWPVERFAELCGQLNRTLGVRTIICGSRSEALLGKRLLKLASSAESGWIEDWTGKTSLLELVGIIKGALLLIGNDSSAVHMAAAVGTPAICIVGGGHFGRFIPYKLERETTNQMPIAVSHELACYGCNLKCVNVVENTLVGECIFLVSVEEVLDAACKFIDSKKSSLFDPQTRTYL